MRVKLDPVPSEWTKAQPVLDQHARSIGLVLDRGFQVREQIREVHDVVIDTDALPVALLVASRTRPLAVLLLSAVVRFSSDGKSVSGGAITWEWRNGTVRLHAIDGLAASTIYNATIAILE